jgi:DNA-binding NarL/FixJ family response regulator
VVRVVLLEESAELFAGLRALIESRKGFEVLGGARGRDDALAIVSRTRPDIILLDLARAETLEFLVELRRVAEGSRILVLTGARDPAVHYRALRSGAMGIVMKEQVESLGDALEAVHAGRAWIDGAVMAQVLALLARGGEEAERTRARIDRAATLTRRERQIVDLVTLGMRNQEVADQLFLSEGTVRNHLTAIFRKLGLSDRCELIAYSHGHPPDMVRMLTRKRELPHVSAHQHRA